MELIAESFPRGLWLVLLELERFPDFQGLDRFLEGGLEGAAPAEEEIEEDDEEDEVEAAAAVVAPAGTSVETAAANEEDQDDEEEDHGAECSTRRVEVVRGSFVASPGYAAEREHADVQAAITRPDL